MKIKTFEELVSFQYKEFEIGELVLIPYDATPRKVIGFSAPIHYLDGDSVVFVEGKKHGYPSWEVKLIN
jgi:hypothetical protein